MDEGGVAVKGEKWLAVVVTVCLAMWVVLGGQPWVATMIAHWEAARRRW